MTEKTLRRVKLVASNLTVEELWNLHTWAGETARTKRDQEHIDAFKKMAVGTKVILGSLSGNVRVKRWEGQPAILLKHGRSRAEFSHPDNGALGKKDWGTLLIHYSNYYSLNKPSEAAIVKERLIREKMVNKHLTPVFDQMWRRANK